MFINISAVLHVFDIGPPVDEAGVPIKVVPELTDGLIAYVFAPRLAYVDGSL